MSIEVKQLIIKSTLVSESRVESPSSSGIDIEALKQQVVEQCRELIEQRLESLQER